MLRLIEYIRGLAIKMKKLLLLGMLTFVLLSCGDDRSDYGLDEGKDTAVETSNSDGFFNHIFNVAYNEIEQAESEVFLAKTDQEYSFDQCATVNYYLNADNSYIENLTIDYQDDNCLTNGRKRIGKIHVFMTGRLKEIGTKIIVSMQNFSINGFKIEGTQTSVFEGLDGNLNPIISQVVENGKISVLNGDFLTFEGEKEVVLDIIKQQFRYSFTSEGISSKGVEFELFSETDLISDFSCGYIQTGIVKLITESNLIQSIDYGSGECDNIAIFKSADLNLEISLN